MKAVMVMFDTLSRRYLSTYGNDWVQTPNFERLKEKAVQFNSFYAGSLPACQQEENFIQADITFYIEAGDRWNHLIFRVLKL